MIKKEISIRKVKRIVIRVILLIDYVIVIVDYTEEFLHVNMMTNLSDWNYDALIDVHEMRYKQL